MDRAVEVTATRYVYWLDRFSVSDDPDDWGMVLQILAKASERGIVERVVARAKEIIGAEPRINAGV